ncbi:HlyD family type I secretion periplasmic adaptor subunit [Dulcicalothrix desertica PCC 7102]|uniref:HlyD family type I secretion periplasmic adaptor subunit n=1 Tax=Dulcicalothrix desertica PCC 7102 TaxID=232991 RepID=A0A433VVA3_9CYAN|nr:HlyD family efflux transporter periplasmic adaptor subunit [Dulcicalothrix desertica]RUT10020.1 HlyD family type I secretion periplasmic adaptor subunit [Dulcicalothrix desertica PCC 7102]TWH41001.1 HlyD family secretion protein [Dulcicalothrix desertica PCC 7102]
MSQPFLNPLPEEEQHQSQSDIRAGENHAIRDPVETFDDSKDLFHGSEELLDALPRLWTRGLLYVLLGFGVLALPWSMYSKVDETGSARGRIEPKGATLKLDSEVGGSVKAVKVKEGETVKAGQVLLELDSEILRTQIKETEAKLVGLQNQRVQLNILKNQLQLTISVTEQQNKSQESEKLSQINQAKQNLDSKQSTYNLQKSEKQALVSQALSQIQVTLNDKEASKNRLSIDSKQVERFNNLVKDGAISAMQVDQLKKEEQESKRTYQKNVYDVKQAELRLAEEKSRYQTTVSQLESDIKQAKLRLQEVQDSYTSLQKNGKLAVLKNEQQLKDLIAQITANQSAIAQTTSQMTSLKLQLQQRIVMSPLDGIIFELPFSKPGTVVQPGQRVAQIAPKNVGYVLKASIPSQDSGFLKVGMPVKIKFDAYPFQEHGIVPGKVARISPDSKVNQTPSGGTIETYDLEIALEQQYVNNGSKRIPLTAGQTATAEVIIRQRRVIDFVLDPFKKLQKGGLEV